MLRNIHFFNIKPGADEERVLHLLDNEIAEYARTFGCIERKTWKLLNAISQGEPAQSAAYMNEALWPSQKEADAFTRGIQEGPPEEVKKAFTELRAGVDIEISVRYVGEEG